MGWAVSECEWVYCGVDIIWMWCGRGWCGYGVGVGEYPWIECAWDVGVDVDVGI